MRFHTNPFRTERLIVACLLALLTLCAYAATKTYHVQTAIKPMVAATGLQITALPMAQVGQTYMAGLNVSGGTPPYTWVGSGLPAGLAMNSSGQITGTPTASSGGSPASFSAIVSDSSKPVLSASGSFAILINPASSGLSINPTSLPSTVVGTPYTFTLLANGGTAPYSYALAKGSSMPAGLALSASGAITGTPTAASTAGASTTFAVTVTDSSKTPITATISLSIQIQSKGSMVIPTINPPSGTVGTPYNFNLGATGGTAPYTWTITGLPAGLSATAGGAISGTPTTASSSSGAVTTTASVKDSSKTVLSATATFVIQINPAMKSPLVITSMNLPPVYVGTAYSTQLAVTGGKSPYTWALGKGTSLPSGLALSSSGLLSGTLTTLPATTPLSMALTVTDSSSAKNSVSASIPLNVYAAVAECTNNGSGNALLKGQYAVSLSGTNAAGEHVNLVGSWVADGKGNLSAGIADINAPTWTAPSSSTFTGTYSIGGDNRGMMTLISGGSSSIYCFAADQANSGGVAAGGWLMRADTSGQSMAGTIELQSATAFTEASLKGNYTFGMQGSSMDQSNGLQRVAVVGYLTLDGAGNVTAGEADMSQQRDDSSGALTNQYEAQIPLSGTYTVAAGGRGTLKLQTPDGGSVNFAFQVISGSELRLLEVDDAMSTTNCCNSVLAGQALLQSATGFSKATLKGTSVYIKDDQANAGTQQSGREIEAGILTFDGSGKMTVINDDNSAGTVSSQSNISATYSVDSHGRVTVLLPSSAASSGNNNPVFYLAGENQGFGVSPEIGVGYFNVMPQTVPAAGFTLAGFAGGFGMGTIWPSPNAKTQTGAATVGAGGSVSATVDSDRNGAITTGVAQTGTMSAATNGRFLMTPAGSTAPQTAVYLVSPTKAYLIDISGSEAAPLQVIVHK